MADIQLNMRVSEQVAERFRSFCKEQGLSQPQGIDSLLSMMDLVQAKEAMPNRQTEIEGFQMHIKAVMDAFVNSLAINADAEERIKAQFISAMESKDKTIIALQEKKEKLQIAFAQEKEERQNSDNRAMAAEKAAATATEMAQTAQQTAEDKIAIIEMLTTKLHDAEQKLGDYDNVKDKLQTAQETILKLQNEQKEAEYTHKSAIMEIEYKIAKEKAEMLEQIAREREELERNHYKEIKTLYEKMSMYQDQISALNLSEN